MKISSRQDVEAPIDQVFSVISDFSRFQDQMQRRGVEIVEDAAGPKAGMRPDGVPNLDGEAAPASWTLNWSGWNQGRDTRSIRTPSA